MNKGTDYDERERKVCSPCCHQPDCPNTNCLGRLAKWDSEKLRGPKPASIPAALIAFVIFLVAAASSLAWIYGEMS